MVDITVIILFESTLSLSGTLMTREEALVSETDAKFGTKVGQIGPKWDKSETFSDQISVHFGVSQNVLKSDLKKSRICLIWG